MIVLDASVLIGYMVDGDAHGVASQDILDTDDEMAIHPMTLAEVLVGPARVGLDADAVATIDRLGVERLIWRDDEPLHLARLRAHTTLKLPDCCVLAAAEHTGATLATFDARLAEVARTRGVRVVGVT